MRRLLLFLIFISLLDGAQAQWVSQQEFELHFLCDSDDILKQVADNASSIEALKQFIWSEVKSGSVIIDEVYVEGYASPDGALSHNSTLARGRMTSTVQLLTREPLWLPNTLIYSRNGGVAWDKLRREVEHSQMPYRAEVLEILRSRVSMGEEDMEHSLKMLGGGVPYKYMQQHLFEKLRYSSVVINYHYPPSPTPPPIEPPIEPSIEEIPPQMPPAPLVESILNREVEYERVPLFALKSNLLFDALTLINLELEVPIGSRWSVAGELTFPWWVWENKLADSKRCRIQLINAIAEGRYWFGDREEREVLTGGFVGVYAGGGLYDFELRAKGYQGEFFVAAGLSGGYAHALNRSKSLRMEYSLGFGYLQTRYKYYYAEFCGYGVWHAVEQRRGVYHWLGPTRAKVSIAWLFNCRKPIYGTEL